MKKVLGKTIFIILIFVGIISIIFNMNEKKVIKDKLVLDYYLANNENKTFDVNGDGFPIPLYNYAEPFDIDFKKIADESNIIDRILPYYPLGVGIDERETELIFSYDNKTKSINLPYEVNNQLTFKYIELMSYTDEKTILSSLDIDFINREENGVYITERFLDYCDIDYDKDLKIKVTISVPIIAKIENRERIYFDEEKNKEYVYDYESYEIVRYEDVEYTFLISGVIKKDNLGFETFDEATILIPYNLSQQIYTLAIENSSFVVEEDELFWRPSTYIVTLRNKANINEVAIELSNYIDDFILEGMCYQDDIKTHIYSKGVEVDVDN